MSDSITHTLIATPNPSLWALLVQVKQSVLATNPNLIPAEGALYKNFEGRIFDKAWLKEYGNYRYLDGKNGQTPHATRPVATPGVAMPPQTRDGEATVGLLFFPTLSQQQRDTPFRTTSSFGNHRWPPILDRLEFFSDPRFPRSTNSVINGRGTIVTGPTYYVRQSYRPECNEGSRFVIEEFLSDVPYAIPFYPVPVERSVSYDVPGAQGSFPTCIGPAINIPAMQSASLAFFAGNSTAINTNGSVGGQYFPATDFEEWSPYTLSDQQTFDNGYKRTRVMVFPPLVDEEENIR